MWLNIETGSKCVHSVCIFFISRLNICAQHSTIKLWVTTKGRKGFWSGSFVGDTAVYSCRLLLSSLFLLRKKKKQNLLQQGTSEKLFRETQSLCWWTFNLMSYKKVTADWSPTVQPMKSKHSQTNMKLCKGFCLRPHQIDTHKESYRRVTEHLTHS